MRKGRASLGRTDIDRTKLGQDARPAPGAFLEAPQIVLLIRRVDAVVIKGKADKERVHIEPRAEGFDDGDGGAAADDDGRLAEPTAR